jgi:hypothetical protein
MVPQMELMLTKIVGEARMAGEPGCLEVRDVRPKTTGKVHENFLRRGSVLRPRMHERSERG